MRNRTVAMEALGGLDGAVERHPRHHLGMGEVLPGASHFPDPFVRLVPARLDVLDDSALERPGRGLRLDSGAAREMHAIDELAVDVELELTCGRIADPHRRGALVAGEPSELE